MFCRHFCKSKETPRFPANAKVYLRSVFGSSRRSFGRKTERRGALHSIGFFQIQHKTEGRTTMTTTTTTTTTIDTKRTSFFLPMRLRPRVLSVSPSHFYAIFTGVYSDPLLRKEKSEFYANETWVPLLHRHVKKAEYAPTGHVRRQTGNAKRHFSRVTPKDIF